jgi:hypothetical protein
MLRTYADLPGWFRLTNALPGLRRAQAVAILRGVWIPSYELGGELVPFQWRIAEMEWALRNPSAGESQRPEPGSLAPYGDLASELARLRAIEASTIWRVTARFRQLLEARPMLRGAIRAPLAAAWRGARGVRNALKRR